MMKNFNVKFFSMLLFAALMSVSFTACGNDDDDDPIENGRNDDNGTGIVNNGGNGDEKLTPDDEKNFLDETARLFLSYFDANDFQELVNVSKQLETVSDDDKVFDKWAEGFLSNTLTGIEEAHASSYNYDMYLKISYYDRLLVASNFNGKFSASYNGKWKKDGESNDLILSFTDKDNVEWVMTVKKSGNIKGKIHASNSSSGSYVDKYKYSEQRYKNYIEIPENVNVIVTRQGKEQINIKLNVASMDIKDGQYDITSSLNATATGNVVGYNFEVAFNYAPNAVSTFNATLKKNSTLLYSRKLSARIIAEGKEVTDVKDAKCDIDILGRVQMSIASDNAFDLNNALNAVSDYDEDGNRDSWDLEKTKAHANEANKALNKAYITNNGGRAEQATMNFVTEEYDEYWQNSWEHKGKSYRVVPALKFADGTSYLFDEYFTKAAFGGTIDSFNDLVNRFKKLDK